MLECEVEVAYFSNMKTVYLVHGRAVDKIEAG